MALIEMQATSRERIDLIFIIGYDLIVIQFKHWVDEAAVVAQAGHFALSAEFACRCKPTVEQAALGGNHRQAVKENVLEAFGLIVRVFLLQQFVEQVGKFFEIFGLTAPLDEPLMASAATVAGIYWSGGVVEDRAAELLTCFSDSGIGVMHHKFFAKGVDIVLGATGNCDFDGVDALDFHCVAERIAPQAVA